MCIHICIHICICIYIYIYIYVRERLGLRNIYIYIYIYIYICMYTVYIPKLETSYGLKGIESSILKEQCSIVELT